MTSIKYDRLQIMGAVTEKFHQNPLKTVRGVAETRLCLRTDGLMNGLKDEHIRIVSSNNVGGHDNWKVSSKSL